MPVVQDGGHHVVVRVEQEGGQLRLGADPAGQDHGLVGDELQNLIIVVMMKSKAIREGWWGRRNQKEGEVGAGDWACRSGV